MKKVLGGKEKACDKCGQTMVYLKVRGIGVVSQCKKCGNMISGRARDEIKIYSYEVKE